MKGYKSRVKQYGQSRTFKNNQKSLYEELDGKMRQEQVMVDAEDTEWIMTVEKELECVTQQGNINIIKGNVSIHLTKMQYWKVLSPVGLHGFWLKKITSLHQAMVKGLDDFIQAGNVPSWMVKNQTVLIQKDARKGNSVGNYRPVVYLNLLWNY